MKVFLADHSGFCFGVREAVAKLDRIAGEGVYTYGDIIHNKFVVEKYRALGVKSADRIEDVPEGAALVIRAHGAPERVYEVAAEKKLRLIDATCPFVSKIHHIVRRASEAGRKVVVFGNESHPEVRGIVGWCRDAAVFRDVAAAIPDELPVTVVVQTTYDRKLFERSLERIKQLYPNAEVYNTVCRATEERQMSARKLAEESDLVVVVGDRNSSNTGELKRICTRYTETIMVEGEEELVEGKFSDKKRIGVIAGASTPDEIIEAVVRKLYKERNSK